MTAQCLWVDDKLRGVFKKAEKLSQVFRCTFDFAADFPTAYGKLLEKDYDVLITDNIFVSKGYGGIEQVIGHFPPNFCAGEAFIEALITRQIQCRSDTLKRIVLHSGIEIPPYELLALDDRVKYALKTGTDIDSLVTALGDHLVRR